MAVGYIYALYGTTPADWLSWSPGEPSLTIKFTARVGVDDQLDPTALIQNLFTNLGIDWSSLNITAVKDIITNTITAKFENLFNAQQRYSIVRATNSIKSGGANDTPLVVSKAIDDGAATLVAASKFLPVPTTTVVGNTWEIDYNLTGVMAAYKVGTSVQIASNFFRIVRDAVLFATNSQVDLLDTVTYPYVIPSYATDAFKITVNVGNDSLSHWRGWIASLIVSVCEMGILGYYEWVAESLKELP